MNIISLSTQTLTLSLGFILLSSVVAFLWAPALIDFLYKYKIIKGTKVELDFASREMKAKTPVMGGLLVIVTVAVITVLFNWERSFTWVPIGVMLLAAFLGGTDDLLNIFGGKRRNRSLEQTTKLMRVHHSRLMRIWYFVTLPWVAFKSLSLWLGSHPGRGVQVHEKLLLQFAAGSITAWWIYFKLGESWQNIGIPFDGTLALGWWVIPLVIFIVMFTANAVNISDGMDGLAGGMLITTFIALTLLSWIYGIEPMAILNATTAGALVTYTYFNVKPARFHMGDVGSLGLGALLAVNALVINQMAVIFFLGFMFYIEAISVLIQVAGRYILGRRIFKMAPLHHHFELKGWSEEKVTMRFWIIGIVLAVACLVTLKLR